MMSKVRHLPQTLSRLVLVCSSSNGSSYTRLDMGDRSIASRPGTASLQEGSIYPFYQNGGHTPLEEPIHHLFHISLALQL